MTQEIETPHTESYRLPNGKYTSSDKVFFRAWNKILRQLRMLGFRVIGFDPSISLACADDPHLRSFELPLWAATLLFGSNVTGIEHPAETAKRAEEHRKYLVELDGQWRKYAWKPAPGNAAKSVKKSKKPERAT